MTNIWMLFVFLLNRNTIPSRDYYKPWIRGGHRQPNSFTKRAWKDAGLETIDLGKISTKASLRKLAKLSDYFSKISGTLLNTYFGFLVKHIRKTQLSK